MRGFFARHQPPQSLRQVLMAGLGGVIAIGLVGILSVITRMPLIMAPFGASCVLLFSLPKSPLSQPAHVVGGHMVATAIGLALRLFLPNEWWAAGLAVGLAIAVMASLRVTHPPAGADPLVVFASDPGFHFLVLPVMTGALMLVAVAAVFHRLSGGTYPLEKP